MKRGLKVPNDTLTRIREHFEVTIVSPMKRGLKGKSGKLGSSLGTISTSYNRFPDEKGTERRGSCIGRHGDRVTIVSPMKRGLKEQRLSPVLGEHLIVTIVSPMKRGLKENKDYRLSCRASVVTIVSPMKRGLKAPEPCECAGIDGSYNRFPDEKGTESDGYYLHISRLLSVTIVSPMKRGLKDQTEGRSGTDNEVTIVSPMKRGLKAGLSSGMTACCCSYNRFPDEKGTEREAGLNPVLADKEVTIVSPMKRGLKGCYTVIAKWQVQVTIVSPMKRGLKVKMTLKLRGSTRYNRFPDEKGTEREAGLNPVLADKEVTIVSPMKRGLKVQPPQERTFVVMSYNRFPR